MRNSSRDEVYIGKEYLVRPSHTQVPALPNVNQQKNRANFNHNMACVYQAWDVNNIFVFRFHLLIVYNVNYVFSFKRSDKKLTKTTLTTLDYICIFHTH